MTKPDEMKWLTRRLSAWALVLLIPLAGLPRAWGRSGSGDAAKIERGSALAARVEKAKKVRVLTPAGELTLTRPVILPEGVASSNRIGGHDRSTVIPWMDVRTIQVRKNAIGRGVLIGSVIGVGLGLAAIAVAGGTISAHNDVDEAILYPGLTGLVSGLVLGSVITSWRTVHTAAPAAPALPRISLMPARAGGMMVNVSLSF